MMNQRDRAAFDAMRDALDSIGNVDDMGEGQATVDIDYSAVVKAQALTDRAVSAQARIRAGLCVTEDRPEGSFSSWCITHDVKADLGHDLDVHGTTNPDGTARND